MVLSNDFIIISNLKNCFLVSISIIVPVTNMYGSGWFFD